MKSKNKKHSSKVSTYNPDFVAMIKQSKKQADEGKFTRLDPSKSLWENLQP